jgi:hypothetical protein
MKGKHWGVKNFMYAGFRQYQVIEYYPAVNMG